MPLETANTVLASAPYYDDFNEDKKYHRVLFRPSVPLQARELNQAQSILQNQIERFGDFVTKSGSIIKGGGITTIEDAKFIVVEDNSDTENEIFQGALIVGEESGVEAIIYTGIDGYSASSRPSKFFIKYTKPGRSRTGETIYTFIEGINGAAGEQLNIYKITEDKELRAQVSLDLDLPIGEALTNTDVAVNGGYSQGTQFFGGSSGATGTVVESAAGARSITLDDVRGVFLKGEKIYAKFKPEVSVTISNVRSSIIEKGAAPIDSTRILSSNPALGWKATGNAYCVQVDEAIVYQKGFFIKTDRQILVVNPSAGGTAAAAGKVIGYETEELVIDEYGDNSLYDNASGFTNEAAPGAHRLQLLTSLVSYNKSDIPADTNFFSIAEFGSSGVLFIKTDPQFGAIEQTIAKRTYDESGHYSVRPFSVTTKAGSNTQTFSYNVSEGLAYVGGIQVSRMNPDDIIVDRGIDTETEVDQIITTSLGDYVLVNEVKGLYDTEGFPTVNLYSNTQSAVTNRKSIESTPSGTLIGTANIRDFTYDSGIKGSSSCKYKLYLFDIKMNEGKSFKDVKSICYTDTSVFAFADLIPTGLKKISAVAISAAGTNYVPGDIVRVSGGNGTPAFVEVKTVNGSGGATSVSIYDGGSYTAVPSGVVTTSYTGIGSGLTLTISTTENILDTRIRESEFSKSVYSLPKPAVKNLKDSNNAIGTSYYYTAYATANIELDGTASFDLGSLTNSILGFSDSSEANENKLEFVITGANDITTGALAGSITAVSNVNVTGVGVNFLRDFQPGERIKYGANSATVVAVTSETSMVVNSPVTFGTGVTGYSRIHERGSLLSIAPENRLITSINQTEKTFTLDLGTTVTASTQLTAKVTVKKNSADRTQKYVNKNVKVRLYQGELTGKINGSGTTITSADTGNPTLFEKQLSVGSVVQASNGTATEQRAVVSIASNTQMVVNSAFSTGIVNAASNVAFSVINPKGVWSLGFADVYKINKIYKTTSILGSDSIGEDVTREFSVDFGQRDTYYDHATIRLRPNSALVMDSDTKLIVDFNVLVPSTEGTSGFFSIESYPVDDSTTPAANTIPTWEIPSFYSTTAKKTISLRDSIDFRPVKSNTAVLTTNAADATLNPVLEPTLIPGTEEYINKTTLIKPVPGDNLTYNYTYYLPRRDVVVVTNKGTIEVRKGVSGLNPKNPSIDVETTMAIANAFVPPYPSMTAEQVRETGRTDYAILVNNLGSRRFTMKDISVLEQRISNLEYQTALTLLEKSALQLSIPNENGIDRFKNGIFVDPFDNLNFTDSRSGHNMIIDTDYGVGRPNYSSEVLRFELNDDNAKSANLVTDDANKIVFNKDFLTIVYNDEVFIEQMGASKELLVDNDVRYTHGTVSLTPSTFADVRRASTYSNVPSDTFDSYYQSTSSTQLIYPSFRTIKFVARGLLPNARHYISLDKVDYSSAAVQGKIETGLTVDPSNVQIDGLYGAPIYSDSKGMVFGIVTIPGDIALGNHTLNVTGSRIDAGLQFSSATGGLVVDLEVVVPPPIEDNSGNIGDNTGGDTGDEEVDTPDDGDNNQHIIIRPRIDAEGARLILPGVDKHTITYSDVGNYSGKTPTSWSWEFAIPTSNGFETTKFVTNKTTATGKGPHTVEYTLSEESTWFDVKLQVTVDGKVYEDTHRMLLLRSFAVETEPDPVVPTYDLKVSEVRAGVSNPSILSDTSPTVTSINDAPISLTIDAYRLTGSGTDTQACIVLSSPNFGPVGGASGNTVRYKYSDIGVDQVSITDLNNGNLTIILKWISTIPSGDLKIEVKKGNSTTGETVLTRFVKIQKTQTEGTVVPLPNPGIKEPVAIRPIGGTGGVIRQYDNYHAEWIVVDLANGVLEYSGGGSEDQFQTKQIRQK